MDLQYKFDKRKLLALCGRLVTKGMTESIVDRITTKYMRDWYNCPNLRVNHFSDWTTSFMGYLRIDDGDSQLGYRIMETIKTDFAQMPNSNVHNSYKLFRGTKNRPSYHNFIVNDISFKELFLWLRENCTPNDYQLTSLYGDDITLILSDRIKSSIVEFKLRFER